MYIYSILTALMVVSASADDLSALRLPKRYMRRMNPLTNTSIPLPVKEPPSSIPPPDSISDTSYSTSILPTVMTFVQGPENTPPTKSPSSGSTPLTFSSLPPYPNVTTQQAACFGIATYTESIPPTVFVTVDEPFDVTVTANASVSLMVLETLVTPPPACGHTILPAVFSPNFKSFNSPAPTSVGEQPRPGVAPGPESPPGSPKPRPSPAPAPDRPAAESTEMFLVPTEESATEKVSQTVVYSSVPYTSTVTVTRKTPVPVTVPPTSGPDVNFDPNQPGPAGRPGQGGGGEAGDSGDDDNDQPTITPGPTRPPRPGQTPPGGPTSRRLGDVVASIILSGIGGSSDPSTRRTTVVGGVPVVVLPSSVVIGGSRVAIPPESTTSVVVNGVTYGVGPSEVVAPSATITLASIHPDHDPRVIRPQSSTTVVTTGQWTLTVASSVAVISGTTYRIGPGAHATSVDVGGSTVSIGPGGIGLPQETGATTGPGAGRYMIYTVDGHTYSVGRSEAIIGSTTYRVDSGAPQTTTVIGGQTVSLGPGGVGLASTTLGPTEVPSSTSSGAASTQSSSDNAAPRSVSRIPYSELLGWYLTPLVFLTCWLVFA
ncbi:hypothetical protein PV10_05054 [Exophiala mesophila]|uniref:Uncharacterized protein n=1 Tax=Exophiala mesophila TaxID=212818 RepID=A0A0D1WWV5_EXOME|nr:uncharacterized protein PV10_05054 [Exophiala mesophila]KIV93875.1 hypothetical protein PV10_05054 [Exophiala mesophila]